jgi:glycosyltransferase involved in cell wall biosynthesis
LLRFRPRRDLDPVRFESRFPYEGNEGEPDLDGPVLSIVVVVDDASVDDMHGFLDATRAHELRHRRETIVVAKGAMVADDLARLHPETMVVTVAPGASAGDARNVGLRLARGDYLVCFDAPADLAPGALAALVEAHDRGNAYVGGKVRNLTPTAPGWATYLDGPGYGSFSREALLGVGGFDDHVVVGVEALARDRLIAAGHHVATTPLVTFGHRTDLASDADYVEACRSDGRRRDLRRRHEVDGAQVAGDAAARRRVRTLRWRGAAARWVGARRGASR